MVERCEELRHSPDLGFLQKMTMSATIRLLISRSIKLELRTKQDWDAHREAMRLAESDITKRHTQTDIARLKIALDELRYLVVPINIKPFRDALQAEYGSDIRIVHERGIQEAYSRLTEPLLIGSAVSSRGGEALIIREIKDFLSQ